MKKLGFLLIVLISSLHLQAQFNTIVTAEPDTIICEGSVQLNAVVGDPSLTGCTEVQPTPPFSCGAECDFSISGSGNTNVNTNDTVCINVGDSYTGNITINGGTLIVCGDLTPQNINFNGGSLIVIGTADFNNLNMNSSGVFENFGIVTITTFTFSGTFINHGSTTIENTFNVSNSSLINTGSLILESSFNNNGNVTNSGIITVENNFTNNGNGTFNNDCILDIQGNLINNNIINNQGVISAGNFSYAWTPTTGLDDPNLKSPTTTPIATTVYTVEVKLNMVTIGSDDVVVGVGGSTCFGISDPSEGMYTLNPIVVDTLTGQPYSRPMYVYDRFGDSLILEDILIPLSSEDAGIFRLHFFDDDQNTGVGFQDPSPSVNPGICTPPCTSLGEERREVVLQAFEDLSQLLVPGGIPANLPNPYPALTQQLVEIDVRSFFDAGSGTAASATPYFLDRGKAIIHSSPWQVINTGYDPFAELANNLLFGIGLPPTTMAGNHFHGKIEFNFAKNFYTDFTNTAPGPLQTDMYSAVLHEGLHLIGFASVMDVNGNSRILPGQYTIYDSYLTDNGGAPLINLADNCFDTQFSGANTEPGCASPILFNGPNTVNQPVNSPLVFEAGSGYSHFNCTEILNPCPAAFQFDGFAMDVCTRPSWLKRTLDPNEVSTLCDMGYSITNTYGNGEADLGANSVAGVRNYAPGCATPNPLAVAGINDFRAYTVNNASGGEFTVQTGQIISFTDLVVNGPNALLENDINAVTLICVEVIDGGTTAANLSNVTPTGFDYTPPGGLNGQALIRYIPVNANGERGNVTYVFIIVQATLPPCAQNPNDCDNLVCYGDFELVQDRFVSELSNFDPSTVNNSPDLAIGNSFIFGTTIPVWAACGGGGTFPFPPQGNQYIGMFSGNNGNSSEGVSFPLNQPLIAGNMYQLTFQAQGSANCSPIFEVLISENPPCPKSSGMWMDCGTFNPVIVTNVNINPGPAWATYVVNFTVPAGNPLNFLTIRNFPQGANLIYGLLDDVKIVEQNTTPISITQISISDTMPCIDEIFTATYEVCLEGGAVTNLFPIDVEVVLPSQIDLTAGDFFPTGIATIPALALTDPGNPCQILTLIAQINTSALIGQRLPVEVQAISGGVCVPGTATEVVDTLMVDDNCCDIPTREWATYFGGSAVDILSDVHSDVNGDLIVSGFTNEPFPYTSLLLNTGIGIVSFGGTNGNEDIILSKVTNDGSQGDWITVIGGGATDFGCFLDSDPSGDIYAISQSDGAGNIVTGGLLTFAGGLADFHIAKLDGNTGAIMWATYYGGDGEDRPKDIVYTEEGGIPFVYIVGTGTSTFGSLPGLVNGTDVGSDDAYIAKLDATTGVVLWTTIIGSVTQDVGSFLTIASDGNPVIAGRSSGPSMLSPAAIGPPVNPYGVSVDAFVAKVDQNGIVLWHTFQNKQGNESSFFGNIDINSRGEILVGFRTRPVGGVPDFDGWVFKLDNDGTLVADIVYGGSSRESPRDLLVDENDNIYVSGVSFSNDLQMVNAHQPDFTGGRRDMYIMRLNDPTTIDDDDTPQWSTYYSVAPGDLVSEDEGNMRIDFTPDGDLVFAGFTSTGLTAPLVFDVTNSFQLTYGGGALDGALGLFRCINTGGGFRKSGKTGKTGKSKGAINDIEVYGMQVSMYPNPAAGEVTLEVNGAEGSIQVIVTDMNGKVVYQAGEPIVHFGSNLPSGLYIVRIIGEKETQTLKLLKE